MRNIPLTKSQAENASYVGFNGELITIPTVGVATHDGITPGGVLLREGDIQNLNGVDNIVRNSNFQFTQNGDEWLGNSGSATYIADGWFMQHGGGSTSNATQVVGWAPEINSNTYLRVTTISTDLDSSFSILSQRFSRLRKYAGQVMTISYQIMCNVATSITGTVGLTFDDGGTDNRENLISRVDIPANSWTDIEVTFTVPDITNADVIDDGLDHMFIYFWLEAGDDYNDRTGGLQPFSGSFDIANVKIEYGDQATAYSTMQYRDEEAKVQLYYEKNELTQFFSALAVTSPNSGCGLNVSFGNPKWNTSPTITHPTTPTFVSGISEIDKDQFGFSLTGSATSAGSSARIVDYIADSEISP